MFNIENFSDILYAQNLFPRIEHEKLDLPNIKNYKVLEYLRNLNLDKSTGPNDLSWNTERSQPKEKKKKSDHYNIQSVATRRKNAKWLDARECNTNI